MSKKSFFLITLSCLVGVSLVANTTLAKEISMSELTRFSGEQANSYTGYSQSSAGDVNGDGFDDILIGASHENSASSTQAGAVYLVYGQSNTHSSMTLTKDNTVKFTGEVMNDYLGSSVASAGDVNGDGFDDILMGSCGKKNTRVNGTWGCAGAMYLIYGQAATLEGKMLTNSNTIKFHGEELFGYLGMRNYSIASANDVNGDGFDDILVAGYGDQANGSGVRYGVAYLIYGQSATFSSMTLSASTTVKFAGKNEYDYLGASVASAGDVNDDGYEDVLLGSHGKDTAQGNVGAAYLIYGQANPLNDMVPDESNSVVLSGETGYQSFAKYTTSAGDINGDGYADIIIGGAYKTDSPTSTSVGATYLVYGQAKPLQNTALTADNSVKFTGEIDELYGEVGYTVSTAGDTNGDGYDEMLIGAGHNDAAGNDAGAAYLVYGQINTLADLALSKENTIKFTGEGSSDYAGEYVAAAGDVNDDGYADILIGAYLKNIDGAENVGATYLGYMSANVKGIEIMDDRIDNDHDGIIDEYNTVAENGIHPIYGTYNPSSATDYASAVTSVTGTTNGAIIVRFNDNSAYYYPVYNVQTQKTTSVKSINNTGRLRTFLLEQSYKIINAYTGKSL